MPVTRSREERGYGPDHRAEREKWAQVVSSGEATCARCHKPIAPGQPWDLGHTADRTAYTGPECIRCNRSAGGRNGAAVANARRSTVIREW